MDFKYLVLNNYRVEINIDKIMKYGGLIKNYRIFRYGLDVENEMVECNSS